MHACLQDNPKSSQQRQRYETARQQAEQQRVAVQKQAWLKQSLARRRVEASRQQQQLLLHSRAQAFHAKVDAIRSAAVFSASHVSSSTFQAEKKCTWFQKNAFQCVMMPGCLTAEVYSTFKSAQTIQS